MRGVPPGRIAELVRYAKAERAAAVDDLTADRKIATLVAFAATMPAVAADEALEVFDLLMDDLARQAAAGVVRSRVRTLRDLDTAALLLSEAWQAVTAAAEIPGGDIRTAMAALDIQAVHAAARTVAELAVSADDGFAVQLSEKYLTIIRFLPELLETFRFAATPAGLPVVDSVGFVMGLRRRRAPIGPDELPAGVLTEAWRRRVAGPDGVDKRAFTVAFTEALREKLRRHDVYVHGLRRFGDPNAGCWTPEAWKTAKTAACADLGLDPAADRDLTAWGDNLHQSYRTLSDGLADNPAVRIEDRGGRDRLVLTGLDKLDEPETLTWLDAEVGARLPSVDLPEMLLEVHGWVPYLDDFTNVSDSSARAKDMHVSVAAVLCAEATNTSLKPVINEGREALRRGRLFWVEQNYVRDECCSRATARMVAFHAAQPIVASAAARPAASRKPPAAHRTARQEPPDQPAVKDDLDYLQNCRAPAVSASS